MTGRAPTAVRGRKGMGGHSAPNEGASVEWYTPAGVFLALGLEFDLDPCAPAGGLPWIPARRFVSLPDDGLSVPWEGRVWLNPPYGAATGAWLDRLADHGMGVALVFARTETEWWHRAAPHADAVCFIRGRLTFVGADGRPGAYNAGAPSALLGYGLTCAEAVARCGLGLVVRCPAREVADRQLGLWGSLS